MLLFALLLGLGGLATVAATRYSDVGQQVIGPGFDARVGDEVLIPPPTDVRSLGVSVPPGAAFVVLKVQKAEPTMLTGNITAASGVPVIQPPIPYTTSRARVFRVIREGRIVAG